ncbi:type 1 glutamine amidotransferase domain-containing protein [Pseudonocardia kujensis]|uniref:type 1 glutamine amidotransferase domain-containing protein n=1 Tax=Pseudonocardia kujensis TaxID=1128675 RepID=UPI001E5F65EB|nr:type 1 glutamine amidotransferase domain-containing protein [Pseudonocardia kujensis]MCE0761440.1 type 1 glutamine amidotransferase domain-containing protein [Pseudonocardia kujensis]
MRIVLPLPDRDFDTTESAVSWAAFVDAGFEVAFATEHGDVGECDPFLLGTGWRYTLPAGPEAVAAYRRMQADPAFLKPIRYDEIAVDDFDAMHLSGGHSKGMKQYLDHRGLQRTVAKFAAAGKTIGAICHGVLVPARAIDPTTGRSILYGRRVTTLTKPLESWALRTTWYRVGRRYRTYRLYTEDEVRRAVGASGEIVRGESFEKPLVVVDGQFVTGRYPVDVPEYAATLISVAQERTREKA